MAILQLGAHSIHFESHGAGPSLVFVHGGATTHKYWDGVVRHLSDNYHIVTPDLFGCGSTSTWQGHDSLTHDKEAELIRAVVDALDRPVHLIGHSYGAAVCLRMALASGDNVQSMMLIEPPIYRLLDQADETELYDEISLFRAEFTEMATEGRRSAAMKLLVDRFNGVGAWERMSDRAHESLLEVVESLVVGFGANAENPTTLEDCKSVTTRTLLVWGHQTGGPEKMMVNLLAEALPKNRSVGIPGAGHQSPLTHPKQVASLIADHTIGSQPNLSPVR